MSVATIPQAIDALRAGEPIIVVDDEARENEGDIVIAAEHATQERIAWTVRHSSGFLCAPMTNEIADRLELPAMVLNNQDPLGTAYTVSVDAADRFSTGISAADRAHTLRKLADPTAAPASFIRPGHILPLRAANGGVRERPGHTEASVDLLKLAGLMPVAAIAEIVDDDGEMMRLPRLIEFGAREKITVITVNALAVYLRELHGDSPLTVSAQIPEASRVVFEVETGVRTSHGPFMMRAYRDSMTSADHVAIISGEPRNGTIVRVHSECLTGEAFGSQRCECGPQLNAALDTINDNGGVVIYLRGQEGRGIGLINKLHAYHLQDSGLDTLDANLALGLPGDARDYGAAVAILNDLGLTSVRLLTNNPEKVRQLNALGITVSERIPLIAGVNALNEEYLAAKRDRMGHQFEPDIIPPQPIT